MAEQQSKGTEIDKAVATLGAAGYVVIREKSYRQAQERQRVAEALREAEAEAAASARAWARDHCAEERRLAERLTFVYGIARHHGATDLELAGPNVPEEIRAELEKRAAAERTPVADLSRDDRTDRITTAIANTCGCADVTVTVREADGTEAPLRRLARCLDDAGLIDHEGI